MRRARLPFLWLALFFAGTGCSVGGTDHSASASGVVPDVEACTRHSGGFDDAVRNLCISQAGRDDFSEPERRLLLALEEVYRGRGDRAAAELSRLVEEGHADAVQAHAVSALAALHTGALRWTELGALLEAHRDEADRPDGLDENRLLAETLAVAPREEAVFESVPARLPTRINRFGQPSWNVEVNGVRREFLVDTGAALTVLTRSTLEAVGGHLAGDQTAFAETSTSHRVALQTAVVDELRLGSLTLRNHPVGVVDDDALEIKLAGIPLLKLDGIVGWTVFHDRRVELAYDGGESRILPSGGPSGNPRNLFWLGYPMVVAAGSDGTPWFLGLDTGAAGTSLNTHVLQEAGLREIDGGRSVRLGAGGGENVRKRLVRDVTVHLAGRRYEFPEMSITDGVKAAEVVHPDGKLGSDLLRGARVIIDLPAGVFAIER